MLKTEEQSSSKRLCQTLSLCAAKQILDPRTRDIGANGKHSANI